MSKSQKDKKEVLKQKQEQNNKNEFLIVGIGASAGGIQALHQFFKQVTENSGMAYIVILHLSPDHESSLAEVLQQVTKIPVTQVTEKVAVNPNHIYVVPPNRHLTMKDSHIIVSPNMEIADRRAPVDLFFRTLGDEMGPRAVSVVLSGTGANGSMGLKRIKEKGGTAFVQNPREAEFSEMPRHSIATGLVDEVLPVADIPAKILQYKSGFNKLQNEEGHKRPEDDQQALREIFTLLKTHTGHDFSNYKRPTLLRRIERRINVQNLQDLPAYTKYLKKHPEETTALLKDFLISVTNFFRDKKAFDIVETDILPLIVKTKTAENSIRIWVAGCATGEEAYSIAMICAEKVANMLDSPKIQIFATDIDEAAITQAREGYYTLNDAADVSPERLRQFFNKEGEGYRIKREIREMVMFAFHNFIKDPPFSHLDLISCRNVMIYLNSSAQERVVETFHFALNPGGFLFLGSSESVDGATDLYAPFNRDQHIFQSRQVAARTYPVPESVPNLFPGQHTISEQLNHEQVPKTKERITFGELHQQLLEQYAPPSVVINQDYDIVHLTEKAGKYLQIAGGEISQNLLKLVRPELRMELRSAIYQATQHQSAVEAHGLKINIENKSETINIHVRPVLKAGDTARGYILILFEPAVNEEKPEILISTDEPLAKQLEEELTRLKIELRSSAEQHEFQSEELKASNEELQAMNEELRSATEELETSKEELQSMNEELRTVNQELKVKIEETGVTTDNLQNLVNSTDIGTIFLDRNFRVVLFTPAARNIFNLIPADYGRPLSDITGKLVYPDLLKEAETVLEKLVTLERELTTSDGMVYLMRVTPFRTEDDRIKGVVISFIDITKRKNTEKELQRVNERMRLVVESAKDYAIFTIDSKRNVTSWNKGAQTVFGYTEQEILGKSADILFVPEDRKNQAPQHEIDKAESQGRAENERWHNHKNGSRIYGSGVVTPLLNDDRKIIGYVNIMRDLTGQKLAEENLRLSEEKYRTLFNSINEGFCIIEVLLDENEKPRDYRFIEANKEFEKQTGLENPVGKTITEMAPENEQYWFDIYGKIANTTEQVHFEHEAKALGFYYDVYAFPIGEADKNQVAILFNDITLRKRTEENLAFLAEISEDIVRLPDIDEMMNVLIAKIGRHFHVEAVLFAGITDDQHTAQVDHQWIGPDFSGRKGSYDVKGFFSPELEKLLRAGKVAIITDTANDKRVDATRYAGFSIGALIGIPVIHKEKWRFYFTILNAQPRNWRDDEIGLLQEITNRLWVRIERARAERALQASEERLRITMESALDYAIISTNTEGFIEGWNTGAERIFGYKKKEIEGKSATIIFTPEDQQKNVPEKEMKIAGQKGCAEDERWHQRADGSKFFLSGVMWPIFNPQLVGYVKIARDMTEQQRIQEQLRISEERYRIALQSANMAAWDWNVPEDKIVWNEQHYLILGLKPEKKERPAEYFFQFVHEQDRERVIESLKKAVNNGATFNTDFRIVRADNQETRWMTGYASTIKKGEGITERMVGVMFDITDRKRLENQKEEFLSIASHELKTPVTSISVYGELLEEFIENNNMRFDKDLVRKMNIQIRRLKDLISDLLDTTRMSEGQLLLNYEEFELNEVIFQIQEESRQLTRIHNFITECGQVIKVNADKKRIEQVITNLISNAIKYSPNGGDILIGCEALKNEVKVSVADHGIGIDKEMQKRLFSRFYRVPQGKFVFQGMGLGLYICAGIIDRHGGRISVTSTAGQGSVFSFTLPYDKPDNCY